ncbi:hypothetical protein GY21_09630 [Cryobacterium roopkundense]|uniref:Uncharacterized protein n=1 Tax=Cryobacterium roopkundense TaxID=1001240 RepID=A0A099JDX9_9MICO|nr:DUF6412 domain-containing protein [Cryobacterium roopkundense]KGJ75693.1 hypothetical protein GY21_09630 [Cryobacterium roopkundense]MBB5641147.1 hypothetical protein [Cryobacterium roopkundense]
MRRLGVPLLQCLSVVLALGAASLETASGGGDGALLAVFALLAVATVAAASVREVLGTLVALLLGSVRPQPLAAPELALSIRQSVPDAPGKPQARAPGRALAVA